MSLVSNAIPSLFNGVSQQPPSVRLPSQSESVINGYPSVADGLRKRPPTQHLAQLSETAFDDAFVHIINRDVGERYIVVVTDGAVQVFDISDGSAETVTYEAAATYLDLPAGAKASESFAIVTVADYSFIINKTAEVATKTIPSDTPTNFNRWFFPDNWKLSDTDDRYYIGTPGDDRGKVQTLNDLPAPSDSSPPQEGDFYEVVGTDESGFSQYFVIYRSGVWVETHEVAEAVALDELTMPHALVRESDGEFHLREFAWIPRLVGNAKSNPVPSFVGKTLSDIGYHKNRLVVSAGENIIFSGAGDYGNFFRKTVTQVLDDDRVDTTVSSQKVSTIDYILPAENGMMFFSDQTQFSLNVDQLLTPSTVSIDVATSYQMNRNVKPITVGQDIYFVTETGNFSRVREYTLLGGEDIETDATDITAHVPRYLPKSLFVLAGNSNEDLLLTVSSAEGFRNRVYVYKFFYADGEKAQSAWSYWQFADDDVILDASVLNNEIFFAIQRDDGVYLEKMNTQDTEYPLDLDFDLLLDRRYLFTGADKAYNTISTTFVLPYELTEDEKDDFRLIQASGDEPGRMFDPETYTWETGTVRIPGDWTEVEVFGGLNYAFELEFSEQFHQSRQGSITTGRYQLRTFTVVFEDTAFFTTSVAPYGNDFNDELIVTGGLSDFTGKTLGEASLILGSPVFMSGTYSFQIYGNSKVAKVKLINDTPYQSRFVSAEVEGFYTRRR